MRASLWSDTSFQEHLAELNHTLSSARPLPLVNLVAVDDSGALIGFLEVGLRSHADGCDPSHPVAFVEGWFVQEGFRNRGVGKKLMHAAEDWARAQGCREIASDALFDNQVSQQAHEALAARGSSNCFLDGESEE